MLSDFPIKWDSEEYEANEAVVCELVSVCVDSLLPAIWWEEAVMLHLHIQARPNMAASERLWKQSTLPYWVNRFSEPTGRCGWQETDFIPFISWDVCMRIFAFPFFAIVFVTWKLGFVFGYLFRNRWRQPEHFWTTLCWNCHSKFVHDRKRRVGLCCSCHSPFFVFWKIYQIISWP